jgi:hypothetical protein
LFWNFGKPAFDGGKALNTAGKTAQNRACQAPDVRLGSASHLGKRFAVLRVQAPEAAD